MRIIDVTSKAVLTANLQSDTIFRFAVDIDLADINHQNPIIFPSNVIFQFCGGKISNGTVCGSNSFVEAEPYKIFENISFTGTWSCNHAYFEWFGAVGDGTTDDRAAIQKGLDSEFFHFMLLNKIYLINSHYVSADSPKDTSGAVIDTDNVGLSINQPIKIEGQAVESFGNGLLSQIRTDHSTDFNVLVQINSSNVELSGFIITGVRWDYEGTHQVQDLLATRHITRNGIDNNYYRLVLKRMYIRHCMRDCINLNTYLSRLERVDVGAGETGIVIRGILTTTAAEYRTSTILSGCYCWQCTSFGYKIMEMAYTTLESCAVDFNSQTGPSSVSGYPFTLGYPYYFLYCNNVSIISCGCECTTNIMYLEHCNGIRIDTLYQWSPTDLINKHDTTDDSKQIFTNSCNCISFNECIMGVIRQPSSPFILMQSSQNIEFNKCLLRTSDGSVSDTLITV
jgi:hypothetical protein